MDDIYVIDSNRPLDISVIDLVLLHVTERVLGLLQVSPRWEVYTKACSLNLYVSPRARGKKPKEYWKLSSASNVYLAATTLTFIIVPDLLLLLFH